MGDDLRGQRQDGGAADLCPLASTQLPADATRPKSQRITAGYEYRVQLQAQVVGQDVQWTERRLQETLHRGGAGSRDRADIEEGMH